MVCGGVLSENCVTIGWARIHSVCVVPKLQDKNLVKIDLKLLVSLEPPGKNKHLSSVEELCV